MTNRKTVMVVDGQGGGLGKAIVEKIRRAELAVRVIGIGTNSAATMAMLRAGADDAATGENAVVYNAGRVDFIIGSLGIIAANSMLGEISSAMAGAISASPGLKLFIPLNKCGLYVAGTRDNGLSEKIDDVLSRMKEELDSER